MEVTPSSMTTSEILVQPAKRAVAHAHAAANGQNPARRLHAAGIADDLVILIVQDAAYRTVSGIPDAYRDIFELHTTRKHARADMIEIGGQRHGL